MDKPLKFLSHPDGLPNLRKLVITCTHPAPSIFLYSSGPTLTHFHLYVSEIQGPRNETWARAILLALRQMTMLTSFILSDYGSLTLPRQEDVVRLPHLVTMRLTAPLVTVGWLFTQLEVPHTSTIHAMLHLQARDLKPNVLSWFGRCVSAALYPRIKDPDNNVRPYHAMFQRTPSQEAAHDLTLWACAADECGIPDDELEDAVSPKSDVSDESDASNEGEVPHDDEAPDEDGFITPPGITITFEDKFLFRDFPALDSLWSALPFEHVHELVLRPVDLQLGDGRDVLSPFVNCIHRMGGIEKLTFLLGWSIDSMRRVLLADPSTLCKNTPYVEFKNVIFPALAGLTYQSTGGDFGCTGDIFDTRNHRLESSLAESADTQVGDVLADVPEASSVTSPDVDRAVQSTVT